jgi:hypothetical protein
MTWITADVGPADEAPTVNWESGNTLLDATILGAANNLVNLGGKFVNAWTNAVSGAATVQDKVDEKVAEKGIACRGCTSFGIEMAGVLSGTREAQAAYEVLGVYGRALSARFAPKAPAGASPVENRGVAWKTERSGKSVGAQAWEDTAEGAASDVATHRRKVPALQYDNPNPAGKNFVRLCPFGRRA